MSKLRRTVLIAGCLIGGSCATVGPGVETDADAPDFTAFDANPSSPTVGEARTLHGRDAENVILYFVAFG